MADKTEVTRVDNAILYSDGSMLIKGGRFSYPHVLVPQKGMVDKETGKLSPPRWSTAFMMPKPSHRVAMQLIKGEIDKILAEKKTNVSAERKFLRNGDDMGKADYIGHWIVSASEKLVRPPSVRDIDALTRLTEADHDVKIWGGKWGNILIKPWWQPNYGKRVNANLLACQIIPARGRDESRLGDADRISEDEINARMEDESEGADWEDDRDDVDTQGL